MRVLLIALLAAISYAQTAEEQECTACYDAVLSSTTPATDGVGNCNYAVCNRFTGSGGMLPLPQECQNRINSETNGINCKEFVETKCEETVGSCNASALGVDCELGDFDFTECTECGIEIQQKVTTAETGNGQCNPATHTCAAGEGSCPADESGDAGADGDDSIDGSDPNADSTGSTDVEDCAGTPNGSATEDTCGVCGGDGSTCAEVKFHMSLSMLEDEFHTHKSSIIAALSELFSIDAEYIDVQIVSTARRLIRRRLTNLPVEVTVHTDDGDAVTSVVNSDDFASSISAHISAKTGSVFTVSDVGEPTSRSLNERSEEITESAEETTESAEETTESAEETTESEQETTETPEEEVADSTDYSADKRLWILFTFLFISMVGSIYYLMTAGDAEAEEDENENNAKR